MTALTGRRDFEQFAAANEVRLRRALVSAYGVDVGTDVTADALAHAWEHWDRVGLMSNPVGYLYRIGQSSARKHRRWRRPLPFTADRITEIAEPVDAETLDALAQLTDRQRVTVLLVHAYGWSSTEVAQVLGVNDNAVRNDLHRGLSRLRAVLGANQ